MGETGIRLSGMLIFMWDVVLFVWSLDIPLTYDLEDQPVFAESRKVV